MKLYQLDTGAPVDVPDSDVPAALQSGKVGLPAGSAIPYQDEDGSIKSVPIEQSHTIDWSKAAVVPHSALEAQELQASHGGALEQAKAGLEGLASGATLGASDVLEGQALGNTADIEARRKANPWTAGAGQAVGALAPSLLAPEAGVGEVEEAGALGSLARIGAAPTRGVGLAGGAVEGGIRDLLGAGAGDSFVAALAKNVAAKGAGAATEGAIYGATQHLDEQMLGDPDANGESLLAATGHGALLGLGLGAGLGAVGELGGAAFERVVPRLHGLAGDTAARAVSPGAEAALEHLPGGARAAGQRLIDDGMIHAGETSEQIAAKLGPAADEADARAAKILATADAAGTPGPSLRAIVDDTEKEIAALRETPDGEEAAKALRTQLDAVTEAAGVPEMEPSVDRAAILDAARLPFAKTADLVPTLEGPLKAIVQRELDAAGAKAAAKLGGSFLDEYKDAKLAAAQYRALASAPPPGSRSVKKMATAAGLGLLTHGPAGAAGGLALGLAKQWAAERGHSTAAVVLDKLAALRGVERAAQTVDRKFARGIAALLPGAEERAPLKVSMVTHAAGEEPYAARVAAVQRAAADPGAAASAAVGDIAQHAPKVAKAFQSAAVRATNYLAGLVPKTTRAPSITPQFDRPFVANAAQKATFNRAFDVAHDPAVVLKRAAEGRLTQDHVKAMAQIYPARYARVVQQVHERLADLRKPLTTAQKQTIGTLLGRGPDPEMTRRYQAAYQVEAPKPTGPQQPQHENKPSPHAPRRPITAPARNAALNVGRPIGS
jgi:hypothetical protein